jgi:DNA-directed RNA polymerase subunit K/omega|tara:strand:- start:167 stop:505 length:339 start_codon:yes stop_codon:yes gene_type:complete
MTTIDYEKEDISEKIIIDPEDSRAFYKNYEANKKNNKSSNVLNKYEKTKVIYERIQLIQRGAIPFIKNPDKYESIYDIVIDELKQQKIPFIIKRRIGNDIEYWKLEDLIILE